jgi:molybdenum cofactor synthesis domain-containing protein
MKTVPVEESVGMVLGHDVTRIVPGKFKGRAFKKGHIIQAEDIDEFLKIGKEHVYVLELPDGFIHENDAAQRIAQAAAGRGIELTEPVEGRINMLAADKGLLKINVDALYQINSVEDMSFGTLHTNQQVAAKRAVAGTRVVPLVIEEEKIQKVEAICRENHPVLEIEPFRSFKVGIVTTGSEVYHGRIEDKFGPVVHAKFTDLGSQVLRQILVSDDVDMTVKAIQVLLKEGAELIAVTGGMSVDPDDQTPASIKAAGGRVVTYGSPIFPGAMFMLAYVDDVPIVGLPGCVMYHQASVFDLTVPRILAGETLTRADIVAMGHGGFCSNCPECRYPICPFGKGA